MKHRSEIRYRSQLIIKFYDNVELPYVDQLETYLHEQHIIAWEQLHEAYPDFSISRLFVSVDQDEFEALVLRGKESDPHYQPPNFFSFFKINIISQINISGLLEQIIAWDIVEYAYIAEEPRLPASCTNHDDPRFANQGYLKKAPNGIDAEYAWNYAGGCGKGIQFIDVEYGWKLDHEDLKDAKIKLIHGIQLKKFDHGTSVLGIVAGVSDNKKGGTGIAPSATTNVISISTSATAFNTADAIMKAVGSLKYGDVLLLELQTPGYEPIEMESAVFEVIRLGSALGLVIIEPAGNGYSNIWPHDIDKLKNLADKETLNRDSTDFKDSGSIMVAGVKSFKIPHEPIKAGKGQGTNTGNRIDCYAWGDSIDTCSTDAKAATSTYVSTFGGTSGASAIIAGAALVVQGMAEASLSYRLSGKQMRKILSDPNNGTSPAFPMIGSYGLGIMPDLKNIISNKVLNLAPDIYIRDFVGDVGDPHKGAINASPDIILVPQKVKNPQKTFGENSGTENSNLLGHKAQSKQDNFLYARVRNRGGAQANNVAVSIYWSPVSTLLMPFLWSRVDPSKPFSTPDIVIKQVPMGSVLTVSDAITWKASNIPSPGHYCFVGLIGNEMDPAPQPPDFMDWNNYLRFIRDNNNVTWRNFNVENKPPQPPTPPSPLPGPEYNELPFLISGAADRTRLFQIRVMAQLPQGSQIWLESSDYLLKVIFKNHTHGRQLSAPNQTYVALHPHHETVIGEGYLQASVVHEMKLHVYIPKKWRRFSFELYVSQFYRDEEIHESEFEEVGRVTWHITSATSSRTKRKFLTDYDSSN